MKLYVATNGNDAWSGQKKDPTKNDGPFATLTRARDAAREARKTFPADDIEIILRGGEYALSQTLILNREDGHSRERPVIWRAEEDEEVIISGSVPVIGWRRLTTEPSHLHPHARGKVWVADIPAGTTHPHTLYLKNRTLPRARCEGFARTPQPEETKERTHFLIGFPEGAMKNWPDLAHVEVMVIPQWTWTMNILPIASVDEKKGLAETAVPCTYSLQPNYRTANTWVENTLAVLREPGMWVCNPDEGLIYYWPEKDEPESGIRAGSQTELIRIEGDIHEQAGCDHPVIGIEFRNITFTNGERLSWHGQTGMGLQHDWDLHDAPTALVRLRGAMGCTFVGCSFRDSASGGLRMDLTARKNRVHGCTFAHLGGTGITLAGYGLGAKDVNRENEIINCHIHHIGEVWWHSPGIFVWQSGSNHIAHNLIHNTPYTGIVCSGRICCNRNGKAECSGSIRWHEVDAILGADFKQVAWHRMDSWRKDWLLREPLLHSRENRIEYNHIHNVMEIMGDGNGIYISGTGGGNMVRGNVIHDCPSPSFAEGIRCDDDQHDTIIEGNLLYRLGGLATGITIKGVNTIRNNIVASPLINKTHRGMISLEVGPLLGATIERNIIYTETAEQCFYAQKRLGCHGEGPEPLLRDAHTDNNLYHCTTDAQHAVTHITQEQAVGVEKASLAADPLFVNAAACDFRLQPNSPAFRLGFQPIDPDKAGYCDDIPHPTGE